MSLKEVSLTTSNISYGEEYNEKIFDKDGSKSGDGFDFGDLETGVDSDIIKLYLRHDGKAPIYNLSYYIRSLGVNWGGYVESDPDSYWPYNPNYFREGGINDDTDLPNTSTKDYEFMRTNAYNNPEMGIRVHYDRSDENVKSNGLGYNNTGLNFSPIILASTAMDYSKSGNDQLDGYVYPEPNDEGKIGCDGDEALVGFSVKLPEDVVGSGHVQFSVTFKYRYTI